MQPTAFWRFVPGKKRGSGGALDLTVATSVGGRSHWATNWLPCRPSSNEFLRKAAAKQYLGMNKWAFTA